MRFLYYSLLLLVPTTANAQTQAPPFWSEIRAFKKSDSVSFPAPHEILFVGSSSFRLWRDIQKSFPGYEIIRRGFGGSGLKDVNYYYKEIIKPYHARQIVIYGGDNDFASDVTLPVDSVVNRLKILVGKIRADDKLVKITVVSIKPSPSRRALQPKFVEANEQIRRYLQTEKHTSFVDV